MERDEHRPTPYGGQPRRDLDGPASGLHPDQVAPGDAEVAGVVCVDLYPWARRSALELWRPSGLRPGVEVGNLPAVRAEEGSLLPRGLVRFDEVSALHDRASGGHVRLI